MRLGIVQTTLYKDLKEAFEYGLSLLNEALERNCDLICFPEMWLTGFDCSDLHILWAERYLEKVSQLVSDTNCIVLAGTFPEKVKMGVYNTAYIFYKNRIYKRRKRYLFSLMDEPNLFLSGDPPEVVNFDGTKLGVIICYELRFPEISKFLALKGADLLLVPAQWPDTRVEHWRTLLRARAIENQFFTIGINVVGETSKLSFSGFSSVFHPLGYNIIEISKTDGLFVVNMDFSEVMSYRKSIPIIEDSLKYKFMEEF